MWSHQNGHPRAWGGDRLRCVSQTDGEQERNWKAKGYTTYLCRTSSPPLPARLPSDLLRRYRRDGTRLPDYSYLPECQGKTQRTRPLFDMMRPTELQAGERTMGRHEHSDRRQQQPAARASSQIPGLHQGACRHYAIKPVFSCLSAQTRPASSCERNGHVRGLPCSATTLSQPKKPFAPRG